MKLSKIALNDFGEIQSLLEMSVIAFNENLKIIYINSYTATMLGLEKNISLLDTSIIALFEKLKTSFPFNNENNISEIIAINNKLQKWQKTVAHIENKKSILLIGQIISYEDKFSKKMSELEKSSALNKDLMNLNTILENLPELVYWKDKNYIYQGCNKRAAEFLNLSSPAEIIGKTDHDLGWNEEHLKSILLVDHSIIDKGIDSIVEDIIPINGTIKFFLTSKAPLRNSKGEIIGILGISADITDRKKLKEELREAKTATAELERLDNIIRYAPDIIYWKDKNSIYLGGNNQLAIAAGLPNREAIIGKSDYDFPWYKQARKYHLDDKEVIESGIPKLNIEDIVMYEDGNEFIVITNKVPLRNSKNEVIGVLGIATDITKRKKIEEELLL